jgi:molecular chaperone DnaK (HSP70)
VTALLKLKQLMAITILGGDDWDDALVQHIVKTFAAQTGIDLAKDKMAMQRVREAAEKAKIELSSSQQASINLPYITVDAEKNPLFLDETITRAQFQSLTADLLDRCKKPFQAVLKRCWNSNCRNRSRCSCWWFNTYASSCRSSSRTYWRKRAK